MVTKLIRFTSSDNLGIFVLIIVFGVMSVVLPYTALATEVLIFAMAAVAYDLLLGYTGIMIFCQASFFGTGGYIAALIIQRYNPNIFVIILLASLGAAFLGLIFGYLTTQRRGTYSALLTLAFNELVFFIAYQWKSVTGGSDGLGNMPRPSLKIPFLFDIDLFSETRFYYFTAVAVIFTIILLRKITASPFGRVLQGIRENEDRASAIGYNVRAYQTGAFVISAAFMGFAGSLFAMFNNYVDVSYVEFQTSARILMIVLIGGVGTLYGPILGAGIVVLTSDIAGAYWSRWPIILGVMFIACVLFARGGILGLLEELKLRGRFFK